MMTMISYSNVTNDDRLSQRSLWSQSRSEFRRRSNLSDDLSNRSHCKGSTTRASVHVVRLKGGCCSLISRCVVVMRMSWLLLATLLVAAHAVPAVYYNVWFVLDNNAIGYVRNKKDHATPLSKPSLSSVMRMVARLRRSTHQPNH
jgi:cytochrome c-type biogenesis protein CcmH/NrfG